MYNITGKKIKIKLLEILCHLFRRFPFTTENYPLIMDIYLINFLI